jgi:TP901 family phage tail tape measure protein
MAAFNLTAELNLRGPSNLNQVVSNIRRQLSTLTLDLNINPSTSRGIQAVTTDVRNLSVALRDAQTNAVALGSALRGLGATVSNLSNSTGSLNNNLSGISRNASTTGTAIRAASSEMNEFGRQSALAIRRFAAFSVATGAIYALSRAVTSAYGEFMNFNKEFVRLQQVTDSTANGLQSLSNEITRLSTSLGVGSQELLNVSVTLAQAGLSAGETKVALEALAKSALAPSFDSLNDTVEGSIALMRQFGISASDLEGSLGSINAVAAKFAVEAGDIITAIQRTGGVFANASKGVSEGKDALNEFLAVFTSVRATTRESAETIATGLRTIFTRIQRGGTIDALKQYGIELTDLEGKFVGPYEAVRRLSEGLKSLDPRDLRFSQIVEELGGFRQIGKVIPLIQQFETAQKALGVAQRGAGSLAADAATAQEALSVKINKVREQFVALIRDIGQSQGFQTFVDISLKLAGALISVADAAKDVLPAIAAITAIRGVGAMGQFFSGFAGGLGRRPRGFARGGRVPGSGSGDTVPAMLTPGEFVIRKKAVDAIGAGNLHRMNKYANGGKVKKFARGGIANAPMIDDILQTTGSVLPKPSAVEALIKAGGGAVDVDRTLKRTIGDKAYSKASTAGSQKSVLDRFFTDEAARLQDIKSSPLTAFGKSLQDAIRSGQLKGNRVSIISKSRRTKGVPEYLSQLFGIPVQNMVFTQGGDKQPAMDAIRSKGPRIDRVGKFKTGGFIQKFALGGMAEDLASGWDRRLGAAILEYKQGSNTQQSKGSISASNLMKELGATDLLTKGTNKSFFPNKSLSFSEIYQGLSENANTVFQEVIDDQIINSINNATDAVASKLGLKSASINQTSVQPFLAGINKGTRGNLFEEIVYNLNNANATLTKNREGADAPFDFPVFGGLGGGTEYNELPRKWVDAKASFARAKRDGGLTQKAYNQLKQDLSMGIGSGDLIKVQTAKQIQTSKKMDKDQLFSAIKTKYGDMNSESFQSLSEANKYAVKDAIDKGQVSKNRLGQLRSLFETKASGGSISGKDTVPALLTPGEFVINKKAAKSIGGAQLNRLNKADKIQGFNSGGFVQRFAAGGPTLPARPGNPNVFNVTVPTSTLQALENISNALEALGVSASASAQLLERGGAISIRESERAYQADLNRMRIAGASATDIYNAEQRLAQVREQNANKAITADVFNQRTGADLQDIQTRAEAERARLLNQRRTALGGMGLSREEVESRMADPRAQERIRQRSYETASGVPRGALSAYGIGGGDIEQYVNQSMMDTRTLRQMDNQLRQTREQELRNSAAYTSASAAEQNRMMRELRSRNSEEISERRRIVQQLRSDRGMGGGGFLDREGRGLGRLQTAGALFGMGSLREDAFGTGRRGTGFTRTFNAASQGMQTAGFGLTFAGGLIGDTLGKMRGGKEGEALSAGISAFVGSAGIGMMFGPIGALTGAIIGVKSAFDSYRQSLVDATLAEQSQKIEGASIKLQKTFDQLGKSTKPADISSSIKDAAAQLGQIATTESARQSGLTSKAMANRGMFDVGPDLSKIERELVSSARQTNVLQSLPQMFEQGIGKGLTIAQIQASFPPGELDKLKEVFATASGDTVIAGLVAKREEMQTRGADTTEIDAAIKRMSSALFNKDILKPLIERQKVEQATAAAAASASIQINLLAESLKKISAAASKAGAGFEEAQRQIAISAGSALGDTFKIQGPSRQQENILDNIQAYSTNEIRNIVGQIGQQFRFNPALTAEAQGAAVNQRILGAELPKILAEVAAKEGQGFDPEGASADVIKKKLDEVFKVAIPDAKKRGDLLENIVTKISDRLKSRQGITVEELAGDESALAQIMKADGDTLKVFNDLLKQSNDIIAKLNNSIDNWATNMERATSMRIDSQNIGIESRNQLTQALGGGLSLGDMNAAFENTIKVLTQRIGPNGAGIAGTGTLDPGVVLQRQLEKEQEARDIKKQLDTEKPPIDSARYRELDSALRRSTLEARNLATAHQKLQTDSSRAANALTKIGELRQLQESRQGAFLDLLKNVNNPEAMMQFTNEVESFFAQMAGQGNMQNLPSAIAGLERQMAVLKPEDANRVRADFIQSVGDMFRAQGRDPALIEGLIEKMGVGQMSPEMRGLVNEFYKYTDVQKNAITMAAERLETAANTAHDDLVAGGIQFKNTVSAAGQENPIQVQNAGMKSRGGVIYASQGQFVNYQPRGTDTVPAMLSPGEFVVNARATKKNRGLLQAINNNKAGGYSKGGMVYLADGGYVPIDKTIEQDAAALNELMRQFDAETRTLLEPLENERTNISFSLNPMGDQLSNLPDTDPQRQALQEKINELVSSRDAIDEQIKTITNNRQSTKIADFNPRLQEIQLRRENENLRKIAQTGELSDKDKILAGINIPSNLSKEERAKKQSEAEQKLKDRAQAFVTGEQQSQQNQQQRARAEEEQKRTNRIAEIGGPAYAREQRSNQIKAQVAAEKERRKQEYLARNPAARKKAEKELSADQKKAEEARQWYLRSNTTPDGQWVGDTDLKGARQIPKDVIAQYNKNKAQQAAQASRERLAFGAPVNPKDPKAQEKRDQAKSLTPEKMAELRQMRRGEELARRFGWSLKDDGSGIYSGYDAGEEPYDLRTLSAEDRKALEDYQFGRETAMSAAKREKATSEAKAQSDARWEATKAQIAADTRKEREVKEAKDAEEAKKRKAWSEEYNRKIAAEKATVEQQRTAAATKAKADEERKSAAKKDQKKKERLDQAISIAENEPSSVDTRGLEPDQIEAAKKQGISLEQYAFNQNVDKYNAQLNDPTLIDAETESIASKLRDIASSSRYEADSAEKTRNETGWFGGLKTALTFSDPYEQVIRDAKNKAAAADQLLSELQNQQGLSRAERIQLNNRMRDGVLSLTRNMPGQREQFQEMMDVENNAIDVTRDAVFDVATAVLPAGAAIKGAKATTKGASLAYRSGQAASAAVKPALLRGGLKGTFVAGETGSVQEGVIAGLKTAGTDIAIGAAMPFVGAALRPFGSMVGNVVSNAVPKSVSSVASRMASAASDAMNFDFTGYVGRKLAENDQQVAARFAAWQKAEAARVAKEQAEKAANKASLAAGTKPSHTSAQGRVTQKSLDAGKKALEEARQAQAAKQALVDKTTQATVTASKPATISTVGGTKMSPNTRSLMEKSGITEEGAEAYAARAAEKQAAQKATQEAKDAATRAKVDGGKATGTKRYDITEDMGRITEADRKGAVKAMQQAQKDSDRAARKASGTKTSALPSKPIGDMTTEEFKALYDSITQPTLLSRAAGSATRIGGATAGTLGVGGVGAGMYMGPLNPYSDRFIGYDAETQKILREQEEERERIIRNRQSTYRANGGLIYANKGTLVPYQPRGTDTVPAMLTPGEFVINRKAAKQNMGLLKAINNGHNVKPMGFNKGGIVPTQYYEGGSNGPVSAASSGGGVSSISIDTSALDTSFSNFSTYVSSLSSVIDGFTQGTTELAGLSQAISALGSLGLVEGSSLMSNAATSVKEATTAFSITMAEFNSASAALAAAIGTIPKSITLNVSGSIPITVSVQIEGDTGGGTDTTELKQSIMDRVGLAINAATQGGINIDTSIA